MMSETAIRVFEKLSGWTEKSHYEKEHNGYIDLEEDVMTGDTHAFLWCYDKDPKHMQTMRLGDIVFVKP
jgi:hypothetical protein